MSDSVLSNREAKLNRLDPPHDLLLEESPEKVTEPAAVAWMSMAGRDPSATVGQLDRQTSELLAYVQQQNDEIDARQSQLNARLAQLDNELRAARLKSGVDSGTELTSNPTVSDSLQDSGISLDELDSSLDSSLATDPSNEPEDPPAKAAAGEGETTGTGHFQEFDEVERLVAQFTGEDVGHDAAAASKPKIESTHVSAGMSAETEQKVATESLDESPNSLLSGLNHMPANESDVAEMLVVEPQISQAEIIEMQVVDTLNLASDDVAVATADHSASKSTAMELADPGSDEVANNSAPNKSAPNKSDADKHHTSARMLRFDASEDVLTDVPSAEQDPISLDPFGLSKAASSIDEMASSLAASELESERRLLSERSIELDRRKSMLQRMQDETQAMHCEALEMRLATEQLLIEISGKAPTINVQELLERLKSRLDEQYQEQQATIDGRKAEVDAALDLIESKQTQVRQQSLKLQEWVESRHSELKSQAAEVDARSIMLDRKEHRMREEFSQWEAQRGAYQQQLQSLLSKLNLSGIGE